uniref:28S ribosomal protein S22, mitochondrial n=1 Tax=Trichuris muris TaxID=70415 RepID=A0A5S6QDE1_TRIMR
MLKVAVRRACWASSSIDVEKLFTDNRVQELLYALTDVLPEKVFRQRQVKSLSRPAYHLMTASQLGKLNTRTMQRAVERLQFPPVLQPYDENVPLLQKDNDLSGHDTAKFVFVDITFGLTHEQRCVVVREPNGDLRGASPEEKDRHLRLYYPKESRQVICPPAFSSPFLEEALDQRKHLFILNWACVQFEPRDPEFIRVCTTVYKDINARELWDDLQSSRFYGPLIFYLALNKDVDRILLSLLNEKKIEAAARIVSLYNLAHHDTASDEWKAIQNSDSEMLKALWQYAERDSQCRPAMETILQSFERQSSEVGEDKHTMNGA